MNKVIKFRTTKCKACDAMEEVFAKAATKFPNVEFVEYNVEKEPAIAAKFRIRGAPTFVALTEDGDVLSIISDAMTQSHFEKWLLEAGV